MRFLLTRFNESDLHRSEHFMEMKGSYYTTGGKTVQVENTTLNTYDWFNTSGCDWSYQWF